MPVPTFHDTHWLAMSQLSLLMIFAASLVKIVPGVQRMTASWHPIGASVCGEFDDKLKYFHKSEEVRVFGDGERELTTIELQTEEIRG